VSEVNSAACPLCKGALWLYDYTEDEIHPRRCICLEKRLLLGFLGPEIFGSKPIRSQLYQPVVNPAGEIEGDRVEDNLFIKGSWPVVCQHLHWALAGKRRFSTKFHYKIVTDRNLLDVWLGNESYKQRAKEVRDDIETHNSVSDLISDPPLLIIKLGYIYAPNKAAASVFREALGIREVLFRPTWIVEGTLNFYGPGHKTYDYEASEYIDSRFDIVDLGGADDDNTARIVLGEDVAMGPGIETPREIEAVIPITPRFIAADPQLDTKPKHKAAFKPGWKRKPTGPDSF